MVLLVGPGFGTATAGVPDIGYQERHRLALRLFITTEGIPSCVLTDLSFPVQELRPGLIGEAVSNCLVTEPFKLPVTQQPPPQAPSR